jgi:D-alanine-D-alanine ligase
MSPIIKIQKHIEIIRSTTSGSISMNEATSEAIYKSLRPFYSNVGISVINNSHDLDALALKKPDLVFMGLKFVPKNGEIDKINGQKIWLSDYLEEKGIAYTGSDSRAQEIAREKELAKQRTEQKGIKTAAYRVIKQGESLVDENLHLQYPVFVKPTNRGGGYGIDNNSIANNFSELKSKVEKLGSKLHADSLIEEYLPGREFSVAVLENGLDANCLLMPLELIAPVNENGHRFLSGEVKDADTEEFVPVTDQKLRVSLTRLAQEVFYALGARGYGRIDIRLDADGKPHFLEANLLPNLVKDFGNFPKACKLNLNMTYEEMILHIAKLGLSQETSLCQEITLPFVDILARIAAPAFAV